MNQTDGKKILDKLGEEVNDKKIVLKQTNQEIVDFFKFIVENLPEVLSGFEKEEDFYKENSGKSEWDTKEYINSKTIREFDLSKDTIDIIELELSESKGTLSSAGKSMMSTIGDDDGNLTNRSTHMAQVAKIAKRIARKLGLNVELAEAIGMNHDIGHTFNGHTGERILNSIANFKDCGYITHNAMGVYLLERENIIENVWKRLDASDDDIPLKEKEEAAKFIRYMMDGILCHNGEGTEGRITYDPEKTLEQMEEETKKCFTIKGYDKQIISASLEGSIIRYADIIAYLRTDILDGFRMKTKNGEKVFPKFNEQYYQIIGTALAKRYKNFELLNVEDKIILKQYTLRQEISELEKKLEELNAPLKKADTLEEIELPWEEIAEKQKELEQKNEELKKLEEKNNKLEDIKHKMAEAYISTIPQNKVKDEVTKMIQDTFINDLIENSRDKKYITMSPLIRRAFFKLRDLNGTYIVPSTRRKFESEKLPNKIEALTEDLAEKLISTGLLRTRIFEKDKEDGREKTPEEIQATKEIESSNSVCGKKILHYYDNLSDKMLQNIFMQAMEAIENITKNEIELILNLEKCNTAQEREKFIKEKYKGNIAWGVYETKKLDPIKREMKAMFPDGMKNQLDILKLLEKVVETKKSNNIEKILASKMVLEYLGGTTDSIILSILIERGDLSPKEIEYYRELNNPDPDQLKMVLEWSEATDKQILRDPDDDDEKDRE